MNWLRSIIFFLFLFIGTPIMTVLLAPAILFGENAAIACVRIWSKIMIRALHLICGVRYELDGLENLPQEGVIIASNHQSMWETVAFMSLLPRPLMVFKKELTANPVYKLWGMYCGIAIDRSRGVRALKDLTAEAIEKINEGRQIILFPEGTRVPLGEQRPFQAGVAAVYQGANAPCVPIAHNSGAHWHHPGPLKTPGTIIVKILPAIPPGMDRKKFTAVLEKAINDARPDLDQRTVNSDRDEPKYGDPEGFIPA